MLGSFLVSADSCGMDRIEIQVASVSSDRLTTSTGHVYMFGNDWFGQMHNQFKAEHCYEVSVESDSIYAGNGADIIERPCPIK